MESRTFYYARVSTKEQNLDRQLFAFREMGADERDIFTDKASGKNFDRLQWRAMLDRVRPDDTIVIYSLDRMGRNYSEIREEWQHITHELKCNIKVCDMPLLNTSAKTDDIDGRFIADLTLQILSYVAQKERENINARIRGGIDAEPISDSGRKYSLKTGKEHGRPSAQKPDNWEIVISEWKSGKITAKEAMEQTGTKRTTFYKLVSDDKSE